MHFFLRQWSRATAACLLIAIFLFPSNLLAQTHVVSPADLQREVVAASQARGRNLDKVSQFLTSPAAERSLKSLRLDPQKITAAAAALSDSELEQLAARADKAQKDFSAGALTERDLLLIILGVAVLILIIVAVS